MLNDQTLRSKVIRLAHARPDLRDDLLPLLSREAADMWGNPNLSPEDQAALESARQTWERGLLRLDFKDNRPVYPPFSWLRQGPSGNTYTVEVSTLRPPGINPRTRRNEKGFKITVLATNGANVGGRLMYEDVLRARSARGLPTLVRKALRFVESEYGGDAPPRS